jgi:hemerythrin-like domain-containing protein
VLDIESMKGQHAEIGAVMAQAMRAIESGTVTTNAEWFSQLLGDITTKIEDHLKIEDSEVYPLLVESEDAAVRRTAKQFQTNMGGLAEEFASFFRRYRTPAEVRHDPWRFTYETRRIFEQLRYRMQREETDLYPLLDQVRH